MSTKTYTLIPQQSTGRGWQQCPDHMAERWAVVEVISFTAKGKPYKRFRTLLTSRTKSHAECERQAFVRAAKPLSKPGLGQRFRATGRRIIARSLSYDQYHGRDR
jgi:hypothetical protein